MHVPLEFQRQDGAVKGPIRHQSQQRRGAVGPETPEAGDGETTGDLKAKPGGMLAATAVFLGLDGDLAGGLSSVIYSNVNAARRVGGGVLYRVWSDGKTATRIGGRVLSRT